MRLIVLAAVLTLGGCASHSPSTAKTDALLACGDQGLNTFYFPAGTFRENYAGADAFSRKWYSPHLKAMNEPSLSCGPAKWDEAYRFLWLRSFHAPIAVRVTRKGNQIELDAHVLSGTGGYEPGHVVQDIERKLTLHQWNVLQAALTRMNFWKLPTNIPWDDAGFGGVDGAQWIIEGRTEGYHVVDRWGGADNVQKIGLLMLDLAGIKTDHIY